MQDLVLGRAVNDETDRRQAQHAACIKSSNLGRIGHGPENRSRRGGGRPLQDGRLCRRRYFEPSDHHQLKRYWLMAHLEHEAGEGR